VKVLVINSKLDIKDVIPANDRHKKNNTAITRPKDPIVSNSTGILHKLTKINKTLIKDEVVFNKKCSRVTKVAFHCKITFRNQLYFFADLHK
jgi:hypothetical protein